MNKDILINRLYNLIEPIVKEKDCELYHVEYVKEGGENYLRIYIDKSEGVSLTDCENVSRAVSEMLDIEDPIAEQYYLEVSSPGIDRILYSDTHLNKYKGQNVLVKLSKIFQGKKKYEGILIDYNESDIIIRTEESEISIPREKILNTSLKGEL